MDKTEGEMSPYVQTPTTQLHKGQAQLVNMQIKGPVLLPLQLQHFY